MHASESTPVSSVDVALARLSLPLALAGLFLLVFGAKLLLIAAYGNPTPFWDQWDAEAANLYKPYVEGALSWRSMFQLHNEHRIFFSRMLALLLFEVAGGWDPILQMVVNALLHSGFVVLLVRLLAPLVRQGEIYALLALTAIVFALPLGWENTLAGFQSSFYFPAIFSVVALHLFVDASPFGRRWWLALALCLCAYFSLASGTLTVLAAVALSTVQLIVGARDPSHRQIGGIAVLGVAASLMLAFTSQVIWHHPLKAHSVGQFLHGLLETVNAPLPNVGFILHLPLLWFAVGVLREPKNATKAQWLVLAIAGWVAMQMMSVAYVRTAVPGASRYLDIFLILLPLDFAALLWLAKRPNPGRSYTSSLAGAWVAFLLIGLAIVSPGRAFDQAGRRGAFTQLEEANTRAFLATGDIAVFANKPPLAVPYPDAERLAYLLSDPTIRMVLPREIRPDDIGIDTVRSRLLTRGHFTQPVLILKRWLVSHALLVFGLGAAFLSTALFWKGAARSQTPDGAGAGPSSIGP